MSDIEVRADEIWFDNEPVARIYPSLGATDRARVEEALEAGAIQLEGFIERLKKLNHHGLFTEAEIEAAWSDD